MTNIDQIAVFIREVGFPVAMATALLAVGVAGLWMLYKLAKAVVPWLQSRIERLVTANENMARAGESQAATFQKLEHDMAHFPVGQPNATEICNQFANAIEALATEEQLPKVRRCVDAIRETLRQCCDTL